MRMVQLKTSRPTVSPVETVDFVAAGRGERWRLKLKQMVCNTSRSIAISVGLCASCACGVPSHQSSDHSTESRESRTTESPSPAPVPPSSISVTCHPAICISRSFLSVSSSLDETKSVESDTSCPFYQPHVLQLTAWD